MELTLIHKKIFEIRGQKVMLDFDLAALYEVPTKVLKQSIKRNLERFPPDFMFELTKSESEFLRSQIVTLEIPPEDGRGKFSKYLPFAFTEQGVAMLSSVLNSQKAIQMNIAIIRAFVELRHFAMNYSELAKKLAALELKYNKGFSDIHEVLRWLGEENQARANENAIQKIQPEIWETRKRIGFTKKENAEN